VGLRVARVLEGGLLDQRRRLLGLADLVEGAADEEGVVRVVVRALGDLGHHPRGLLEVALAEQRVELEQERVDDLLVHLGEVEGLIAHLDRLVVVAERVDVDLGRVQHRLEVRLVERDGLAVGLDGLLAFTLERRDEAEQVVRLGRLRIELQRATRRCLRAANVAALHEVPTSIEVRRELIHPG
jgi:hypothetical protein